MNTWHSDRPCERGFHGGTLPLETRRCAIADESRGVRPCFSFGIADPICEARVSLNPQPRFISRAWTLRPRTQISRGLCAASGKRAGIQDTRAVPRAARAERKDCDTPRGTRARLIRRRRKRNYSIRCGVCVPQICRRGTQCEAFFAAASR